MQSVVADAFAEQWQCQPAAVARAPGRVNLIGEHIDYEGYGVLPMAIEQACNVAAGWGSPAQEQAPMLRVANTQPQQYPQAALPLLPEAGFPPGTPTWLKYVQAAYRGCVEFAASKQHPIPQHGDMLLMVGSQIPPAAGLSSSSALVVAATLALLELWQLAATPSEVADVTCRCERFVGTQGGGMDQAVSLLAQAGRAMHVEFKPVRAQPVPLPPGVMVVVANSLAPSAKAETASVRFNLRVLECRLAAMLLAHQLSAAPGTKGCCTWQQVSILKQVQPRLLQYAAHSCVDINSSSRSHSNGGDGGGSSSGSAAADAELLSQAVQQLLPATTYTLDAVAAALGMQRHKLLDALPEGLQAAAAAATQLHLQQRACHVFTEAHRVLTFKQVCEDQQLSSNTKLQQLGELLNASHTSCSQLYQCSCEELDTLVNTAREAGALGARLTGAGWGGCIVALVEQDRVETFRQQLIEQYYRPLVAKGVVQDEELPQCVFVSSPSAGATVINQVHAAAPVAVTV